MKFLMASWVACFSLVFSLCSFAAGVNITSDEMERSKDGQETVYSGNVVLNFNDGNALNISSLQLVLDDSGDVYEGDVRIIQDSLIFTTSKAVVVKGADYTQVRMDTVKQREAK